MIDRQKSDSSNYNRLVVVIPFPSWEGVAAGVAALDASLSKVLGKLSRWVVVAALGVGIGLGGVISAQPTGVSALPELVVLTQDQGVKPHELRLENGEVTYPVKPGLLPVLASGLQPVRWLEGSQGIQNGGPTILLGATQQEKEWAELQLADQVTVLGENQGLYTFSVIEVKWLDRQQLLDLLEVPQERLYLAAPTGFWAREWVVVVAISQ